MKYLDKNIYSIFYFPILTIILSKTIYISIITKDFSPINLFLLNSSFKIITNDNSSSNQTPG